MSKCSDSNCQHVHDECEDDVIEYDPEMAQLQHEYHQYVRQNVPADFIKWTEEEQTKKMEELLVDFQRAKSLELNNEGKLYRSIEYTQANLPKECDGKYKKFYDPQYWLDNINRPVRRALRNLEMQKKSLSLSAEDGTSLLHDDADPDEIFEEVFENVYQFQLFPEEFVEEFQEFLEYVDEWLEEKEIKLTAPNTMNKYGVVLNYIGLNDVLDVLMMLLVEPLKTAYFSWMSLAEPKSEDEDTETELVPMPLDVCHAFIAGYRYDPLTADNLENDDKLALHVDKSHVTLNICLSTEFTGGDLFLAGHRCPTHVPLDLPSNRDSKEPENVKLNQKAGQAWLHLGNLRHGAEPILSGSRNNMIMWCISTPYNQKLMTGECESICLICDLEKELEEIDEEGDEANANALVVKE